jgi:hypothetical protein
MVCDTRLRRGQTITERKAEVRRAVEKLEKDLIAQRAKAKVGPQGAIAFENAELQRDGITDNCAYRMLMSSGSALARQAIERAELLAGRKVDRTVVNQGWHTHDNGASWHKHK